MTKTIIYGRNGEALLRVSVITGSGKVSQTFARSTKEFSDFADWNAKQPVPLDLSDKRPEVIPADEAEFTPAERKQIRAKWLSKD